MNPTAFNGTPRATRRLLHSGSTRIAAIFVDLLIPLLLPLLLHRAHADDAQLRYPVRFGSVHHLEGRAGADPWSVLEPAILGRAGDVLRARTNFPSEITEFRLVEDPITDLGPMLEKIRTEHGVPGLAAIVIRSNRVLAVGAVGVRVEGTDAPIMLGDVWHHGSLTKSMTATLAGTFVEEGRIQWDTTLGEVLASRLPAMHPDWRNVTLSQLLRHRSGAPGHDEIVTNGLWRALWRRSGTTAEKRLLWLRNVTTNAPSHAPGTRFEYSNTGYVFAGMMLEAIAGKPWETLMRERIFQPLNMDTAGFGPPGTPGRTNAPWGHQWINGKPVGTRPGPAADNPPALGPAGTVHASLFDLAKYLMCHARKGTGDGIHLLKPETFQRLHTPEKGENYAFGWSVTHRPWARGTALTHTGSNTQWFSNAWIAPGKQAALLVLTNIGDGKDGRGFKVTDEVIGKLVAAHLRR